MKFIVEIQVTNSFDVEIPDGLSEQEIYDYVYDNCQEDIDDAINNGDLDIEIY